MLRREKLFQWFCAESKTRVLGFAFSQPRYVLCTFLNFGTVSASRFYKKKSSYKKERVVMAFKPWVFEMELPVHNKIQMPAVFLDRKFNKPPERNILNDKAKRF